MTLRVFMRRSAKALRRKRTGVRRGGETQAGVGIKAPEGLMVGIVADPSFAAHEKNNDTSGTTDSIESGDGIAVQDRLVDELPALWRFSLRLTRSETDADDLVQKTCVRALEQRSQYREDGRLKSWLFKLCHNLWRDQMRSSSRRAGIVIRPPTPADSMSIGIETDWDTPEGIDTDTPESWAGVDDVFAAVDTLPVAQREVVLLVTVEGFGYREAADTLDIPLGTVMSRLSRARRALVQILEPPLPGPPGVGKRVSTPPVECSDA